MRALFDRHRLELIVTFTGIVASVLIRAWSEPTGDALLGAFIAGGLVSMIYTEGEALRRRARARAAIDAVAEAAKLEVVDAPIRENRREVYEGYDAGPPSTIASLATASNVVALGAISHEQRWVTLTESLRERQDAFISAVAMYLVDLTDDARRDVAEILQG